MKEVQFVEARYSVRTPRAHQPNALFDKAVPGDLKRLGSLKAPQF